MGALPWGKILSKAGSVAGIGMGATQLIQSRQAKKKAMESTPGAVDPNQAAFLAELQQKKNALNTGSQYSSSIDAINDNMAQTQDVLAGNSGGDAGGTISALLKSQQAANRGVGDVLAQGQQAENFNTSIYGDLLNKVAQRKMELGLLGRAQNMAEWAQKSQTGMSNLTAGISSLTGGKKSAAPMASPSVVQDTSVKETGPGGASASILSKMTTAPENDLGTSDKGGFDLSKVTGMLSSFGGK